MVKKRCYDLKNNAEQSISSGEICEVNLTVTYTVIHGVSEAFF
jgi:hypothetical protein